MINRITLYLVIASFPLISDKAVAQNNQKPTDVQMVSSPLSAKFEWKTGGVIIVDAIVNGRPARALIDTGFPENAVDADFARKIAASVVGSYKVLSSGGATEIARADNISILIGGESFSSSTTDCYDLSTVKKSLGVDFDVIIGASSLAKRSFYVNFDTKEIQFQNSIKSSGRIAELPLSFDPTSRRFVVLTSIAGGPVARTMLDTGSMNEFEVSPAVYGAIPRGAGASTDSLSYGPGGAVIQPLFSSSVQLGHITASDVLIDVDSGDRFLSDSNLGGLLGLGLLSRYNFVVDGKMNRLILFARKSKYIPAARSTVGVQVKYGNGNIEIVHVMKGSPAQRAGLQAGNLICAINGKKIGGDWLASPMRYWSTGPVGVKYSIKLCSGNDVILTSALFY